MTRLFKIIGQKNGLTFSYADITDMEKIRAQLRPGTRALYIETPSNPMINITDLRACAALAKEHGLMLIVDNIFLSPYLQNPLKLGVDLVIHSSSKFLSDHNDTISGFLSDDPGRRSRSGFRHIPPRSPRRWWFCGPQDSQD